MDNLDTNETSNVVHKRHNKGYKKKKNTINTEYIFKIYVLKMSEKQEIYATIDKKDDIKKTSLKIQLI